MDSIILCAVALKLSDQRSLESFILCIIHQRHFTCDNTTVTTDSLLELVNNILVYKIKENCYQSLLLVAFYFLFFCFPVSLKERRRVPNSNEMLHIVSGKYVVNQITEFRA